MLACLLLALPFPAPAPTFQDPAEEFRSKFQTAVELNDQKAIDSLLRKHRDLAVTEFVSKADLAAAAGDPADIAWVDAFVEGWQRVAHSSFARKYSRFLGLMSSSTRRNRDEILRSHFPMVTRLHAEALQKKTEEAWEPVRVEGAPVAAALRTIGDDYYLAIVLYCLGNAYNSDLNEDGGDDQKALEFYEEYLTVRQRLDLTSDKDYDTVKSLAAEMRAKLGIPDPETGKVGPRKVSRFEIQPAEGADWVEVPLAFAADPKPGAIEHPCDLADDHRLSWMLTGTHEVGTEGSVYPFEPKVVVRRIEFGKFVLDGGLGPSEPFKLTTKPVTVTFRRRLADGREADCALRVAGGIDRDMYHGAELNLSVNDVSSTMFYRSVSTMVGDSPFGRIVLYDLNVDGAYGADELKLTGAHGTPKDTWLYRYDAVLLGRNKHSQPFSRFLTDGKGGWYEFQVDDHELPSKVRLRRMAPKLGTFKVKMNGLKGVKLTSLVLVAETSQIKGTWVDLMCGRGGSLQVPIGRYTFQQGLVRGAKGAEAIILPGTGVPMTFDLEEGETVEIKLGAPFTFSIERRLEGRRLVLDGETLCVLGAAGERYVRMVGAPPFGIEVSLKGEKAEGVLRGSTAEEVMAHWPYAYLPQSLELELKKAEMPPVRLFLKKHPWFGKIDTGWME
ncbi:MAG: hypothetical protein D6702_07295 [Planctomycetota bacterium]|nr:MAG: hypothetical protein D6702_07295 [Planctomycetota bacterium]